MNYQTHPTDADGSQKQLLYHHKFIYKNHPFAIFNAEDLSNYLPHLPGFCHLQFSVPQIEYPLGGSSKTGSHVYFLLIVAMVLLFYRHIVLL